MDPQKRIVLSRFWVGDFVYHICDNTRGYITRVEFATDRLVPRYYVVMSDRKGEWCEEMELSAERAYTAPENGGVAS